MSDSEEGDFVDNEAEQSSGEDGSESSSEDSVEEGDVEGLINDTVSEKEGSSSDSDSSSDSSVNEEQADTRKRSRDEDLDDEDIDLIQENTGIQIKKRNKFRRVHMIESDDEGETTKPPDWTTPHQTDITDMTHVFGASDDDDSSIGSGDREKDIPLGEDHDANDFHDFIVDDNGEPIRQKKGEAGYAEPLLAEAHEIFGLDFDPREFEQVATEGLESGEEGDDSNMDEYDSDLDSEYGGSGVKKKKTKRRKKKTTIYDVYEPSELERGHFLERDTEIRVTDIPERFQTRCIPVQKTRDDAELEDEARWVYSQAFTSQTISKQPLLQVEKSRVSSVRGSHGNKPQQSTVPKIKEALNLMRNHSFEIPYIANYRREYVEPELDIHDLWKIFHWDEKWMQLNARKANLRRLFERMREFQFEKVREQPDKVLTEDTRPITDEDFTRLDMVTTLEELSDVHAHFSLYHGRDLISMQNSKVSKLATQQDGGGTDKDSKSKRGVRQAQKSDFYAKCQENGLASLAGKYGLSPEQFGENLRDNYQRNETEQHHVEPEEAAEDYVQPSGYFSSVRAVLQGACHMVAMQVACEPLVRQALRQSYQTRAVMNVKPTKTGKKMIDDNHPCCLMKYIRNKPVRELKADEFLKLSQAESDRLLEITISIDIDHSSDKSHRSSHGSHQTYFEEIRQLFYRDEYSLLAEKWNAQRAQALAHALLKVLYPLMEKELRAKLLTEAKDHVMQTCVNKLRGWLEKAPLLLKSEQDGVTDEVYPKVVACAYSSDVTVPAFCCFLDTNGEVNDFRRFGNLHKRKHSPFEKERDAKFNDLTAFKRFVTQKAPELIVVSAESREGLTIIQDFRECIEELEGDEGMVAIPVELMDPCVGKIYSKTQRAKESFPDYPELLRVAVSLGRRAQEPLHEFTALFASPDNEFLSLPLHSLQSALPTDKLKTMLEIEIVNRVNDVGVDVNFAMEHTHTAPMLQYVCGLGPRKAPALIKNFLENARKENIDSSAIQNRSQLVMLCSIGPQMFINCAAFIKIDTAAFGNVDNTYIEVLDSTRIHPETYEWARKMAVDALDYDETGDDQNPSSAVEDILLTPEKLGDLDLDAFAEELERQEYGNKKTTLYDIRNELYGPFKERRKPYAPMSQEEQFSLLTGESHDSLHEGKLVTCTVVGIVRRKPNQEILDRASPIQDERTQLWQCPVCHTAGFRDVGLVWQHFDDGSCPGQSIGVRARLENGLSGFILTKNISDKHIGSPEERVHIGMTIHCRILRVNLDKFSVDLTCRTSDLLDKEGKFSLSKDVYYDYQQAEAEKHKEDTTKSKPGNRLIKRVIVHPSFKNCSFDEAEKSLSKQEQGEAIFRPSSKGMDHLTLTWKVEDGIHQHIDITEEAKPNQFSIGKRLLIAKEEYEDLDEILARFVQPMASCARDIISHKTYKKASGGNKDHLKKLLRDEKNKNPKRIPYLFSASKEFPGKFLVGYMPGTRPRFEYVTVTPDGFRYRSKIHNSLEDMLKWFKNHFSEPIPKPQPVNPSPSPSSSSVQGRVTPMDLSRGPSSTPYTPTHLAYSTPQYGQPAGVFAHPAGGYQQPPQYGQQFRGGYQQQRGHWNQPPAQWGSNMAASRTPGGGRTPAYTPTQTPGSVMSNMYGATPNIDRRRRDASPMGTPLLDEN